MCKYITLFFDMLVSVVVLVLAVCCAVVVLLYMADIVYVYFNPPYVVCGTVVDYKVTAFSYYGVLDTQEGVSHLLRVEADNAPTITDTNQQYLVKPLQNVVALGSTC